MILCLVLATGPAMAVDDEESTRERERNPDYAAAAELIEAGKHAQAIPLLKKVNAREPGNANVLNSLGFAHRKLKRYDAAMAYYTAAIRIEPRHLGANEYLGELYLELGQLAKAEQRLKVLDRACFFGCAEYRDLKKAIAAYKAKKNTGS